MKNETGKIYGRLTVISKAGTSSTGITYNCKCTCGKVKIIRGSSLRNGSTTSCGCFARENMSKIQTIHGGTNKGKPERLYNIWDKMKQRCYNSKHTHYNRYGGRGITICKSWRINYSRFKKWALINGYSNALTINRINNDKNYTPSNCNWATQREQAQNTKTTRVKAIDVPSIRKLKGILTIDKIAKKFNVSPSCVKGIFYKGNWSNIP